MVRKSKPPLKRPRPGGRSARVRDAVFEAVEALLLESPGDLPSMTAVAERAGINPTSLYRRWGDVRQLAGEVAVEKLIREHPLPDTGSVRGDLIAWAVSMAEGISNRRSVLMLRILTSLPAERADMEELRRRPIGRRIAEIEAMLARGAGRGEEVPAFGDVLELVLAPIYLHALFLGPIDHIEEVGRLVDRVLLLARLAPAPQE